MSNTQQRVIKLTMSHIESLPSINDGSNTLEPSTKQPHESKNNEDYSNLTPLGSLVAIMDPLEEPAEPESKNNEDDGEICGICCYCIWNCLAYCCQEHDE